MELGIKVNGNFINNIRYANDTILIVDTIEDLRKLIDEINEKG